MSLLPLAIPPGVRSNGAETDSAGRWLDANLVRWVDGVMQPVGGWETRVAVGSTALRAAFSWVDLSGTARLAFGGFDKLYAVSATNTVTDITPAGLTAGLLDAALNVGYGAGAYGAGYYGTVRSNPGVYSEATTWALDNFGEELLACSSADGRIFKWDLNTANDAVAVSGAPTGNVSMMVTDERFVFALGAGGNKRRVQWCDREDLATWTPATTNEAGDFDLQTSGQIMCGARVRGQALILTDLDAHVATYIGPPFVYGFERVGSSCGPASRKALVATDQAAFWMGPKAFFAFSAGAVTELPCEVYDKVFGSISIAQLSKVYGVQKAQFGEVWWFYPSADSNENDRYVTYNYRSNIWQIGALARTCGVDRGVFRAPIWSSPAGQAYNHETGLNYDGALIYAESGPIQLGNGDNVMHVTSVLMDEITSGDVQVAFLTRFYPNDTERSYGPYLPGPPTDARFSGRQVKMRVEAVRNAAWRLGTVRLEAKQGGLR